VSEPNCKIGLRVFSCTDELRCSVYAGGLSREGYGNTTNNINKMFIIRLLVASL
jgi:hypothetical protein